MKWSYLLAAIVSLMAVGFLLSDLERASVIKKPTRVQGTVNLSAAGP